MPLLPLIVTHYMERMHDYNDEVVVKVTSAIDLSKEMLSKIKKELKALF